MEMFRVRVQVSPKPAQEWNKNGTRMEQEWNTDTMVSVFHYNHRVIARYEAISMLYRANLHS
ncbi:MAG: hypothetical protein JWR38_456 [Mucilaginibacter sp.]|nr:hypothetical protein [Mucilaginibacter sp.]